MEKKCLTLNALNFRHAQPELSCYFATRPVGEALKLADYETERLLPLLHLPAHTKALYTTFDVKADSDMYVLTMGTEYTDAVTPCWSRGFLKNYYLHKLTQYFRNKGLPVQTNLISDMDVWVPAASVLKDCNGYRVFRLRVQFGRLSDKPELLISYDGVHSVFKEPLNSSFFGKERELTFTKLLYGTEFFRYNNLPDRVRRDPDRLFPCLNKALQQELKMPFGTPDKTNRYKRYRNEIEDFRKQYLLPEHVQGIMVPDTEWLQCTKKRLPNPGHKLDMLAFGNDKTGQDINSGLKQYGPKAYSPEQDIVLFFICREQDIAMATAVYQYMKCERSGFDGLGKYSGIHFQTSRGLSVYFKDAYNPLPQICSELDKRIFDPAKTYFAIYLSPVGKWEKNPAKKAVYYKLKEELLHRGILSQSIEVDKNWPGRKTDANNVAVLKDGFQFYMPNIAVAMLAKLGGTPWSLASGSIHDLVIGISAFRSADTQKKYLGSAFCFSGEGRFYGFDCFRSSQTDELAGSIIMAVRRYCSENTSPEKLVIHFYKTLSKKELKPVEAGLARLGLKIPVVVVSVNKSFSQDVLGFDTDSEHLMPASYSYIPVNRTQYLLFNNSLTDDTSKETPRRFPFPMKVSMQYFAAGSDVSTQPEHDMTVELLSQICGFSQLYWKSVSTQSLPVTIRYPEMLAQIVPNFGNAEIPGAGRERLWFL
jgi:hypothetical protein